MMKSSKIEVFAVVGTVAVISSVAMLRSCYRALRHSKDMKQSAAVLDQYFSQDYLQARHRFRVAARAAGCVDIAEHEVCTDDVTGLSMTIDTAVFHFDDPNNNISRPRRLLIHISGTHGVEGFAGSAVQVKLLEVLATENKKNKNNNTALSILFIHALNPYGFHHHRRFNHNNVDLNRNALTEDKLLALTRRDPNSFGYMNIADVLNPNSVPGAFDRTIGFVWNVFKSVARYGFHNLKAATVCGVYHDKTKIMYGGGPHREINHNIAGNVIQETISKYYAQSGIDKIIMIDVHTGLGPCGIDTLLAFDAADGKLIEEVMPLQDKKFIEADQSQTSGPAGGGAYKNATGAVPDNYYSVFIQSAVEKVNNNNNKRDAINCFFLGFTQEFGTVGPLYVLRGMIVENAAWKFARGTLLHANASQLIRSVFYVETSAWKTSVLSRGERVAQWCVDYLITM
eukprot:PhM_4_TR4854/c0_g1_i1/m.22002